MSPKYGIGHLILRKLQLHTIILILQLIWIFSVFFCILFTTHPKTNYSLTKEESSAASFEVINVDEELKDLNRFNRVPFLSARGNIPEDTFNPTVDTIAHGQIRNLGVGGTYCLDHDLKDTKNPIVSLKLCQKFERKQIFWYSKNHEIRRDNRCLEYYGTVVFEYPCHSSKGSQEFLYDRITKLIHHPSTEKCMGIVMMSGEPYLTMDFCSEDNVNQQWKMQNFRKSLLK